MHLWVQPRFLKDVKKGLNDCKWARSEEVDPKLLEEWICNVFEEVKTKVLLLKKLDIKCTRCGKENRYR